MMLWQLARDLTRRLPEWDAPAKLSLAIALALLILLLGIGFVGPDAIRLPARFGAFGLLITMQLLFLWANRRDASPYHLAQQHFINGDYQAARDLLESMPERGRASADALVLLGNTYRNVGKFSSAQSALQRALSLKPQHTLALFSIGKLQLVQGEYHAACEYITRAIDAGAPEHVRFELGQAYYLLADHDEALRQLVAARSELADDSIQCLLLSTYLHRLDAGDLPACAAGQAHARFWRDEAHRYSNTPYGAHLAEMLGGLDPAREDA
jgi:tetratricopeptide (TPR) repeat protein